MMALGRFLYGNWYGAVVAFVIVSAVLCALQFINYCMGDFVPWPKSWHYTLMILPVVNIGVATVVSIIRRKWGWAVGQLALVAVAFVCHGVICFISYCTPTRTTTPPSRKWTISTICLPTSIACDSLTFLGGISQREPVAVFSVANLPADQSHFLPGSPWANMVDARAVDHYRSIMKYCRIDAALPDNAILMHCDGEYGNMTLIAADGKQYLVYEEL
jgi:hypothetical protein